MAVSLEAVGLHKRYRWRTVLRDVGFRTGPGILAVVGPNGAGKTTLLRILAGVLTPSQGCVLWHGRPTAADPVAFRSRLGYKPQELSVYPGQTLAEALRYLAGLKGISGPDADQRVGELLAEWDLASVASQPLVTLSRGCRQRFFLAQALLADPDVLILDEPAVALDEGERQRLWQRLRRWARERVVIVGGHQVQELAGVADRVLVLQRGMVRFLGTPGQLAARAAGCVWELRLPAGDPACARLRPPYLTVDRRPEEAGDGGRSGEVLRLVAPHRPHPAAVPVEPGPLEGYFCCLAG